MATAGEERVSSAQQGFASARRINLPTIATVAIGAAVLHFGKDIFLPLSIAMLITFALSPLVSMIRNRGVPMTAAVLLVVTIAFIAIGAFLMMMASQLSELAGNLPTFQANIVTKLESLRSSGSGHGIISRLSDMLSVINKEIGASVSQTEAAAQSAPVAVEVVENRNAVQLLQDLVLPLISPVATAGLVIVVVVFMLLEREDLRDRFIRLVGANDLYRTTLMLEEAGSRVGRYLLMQLLTNSIYAVPIGLGLWLIGVPNAMLWGLITLVMRFVPYIGTVMSAVFPMFLAFAVAPGWDMLLWTIALFAVVEAVTSNIIEPWLYGSRTGVSPLAIIVSAIVWTWIWGPLGLVISTPLTVCLVVLGRHVPQFKVFDILFGDEPVLAPHSRLYQRLLAGDVIETTSRAIEALEKDYLAEYYRDVGIPALLLAQDDYDRGLLTKPQLAGVAEIASDLVTDMTDVAEEERLEAEADSTIGVAEADNSLILTIGARSALDDVAAKMLAQVLHADGATAITMSHLDLVPSRLQSVIRTGAQVVILNMMDPHPSRATLLYIRRLKRANAKLRVGVVFWQSPTNLLPNREDRQLTDRIAPQSLKLAEEIGADFAVTDMESALAAAFSDQPVKPLPAEARKPARAKQRRRSVAQTEAVAG